MRAGRDDGNAALEFLSLGVLLLVPLLYLALTLGRLQAASMAADGGAVLAARAVTLADTEPAGRQAATAALALSLRDHGFPPGAGAVAVSCAARPCLTPGTRVQVAVTVRAPLPLTPPFLRGGPALVTIHAQQAATVERFRAARADR